MEKEKDAPPYETEARKQEIIFFLLSYFSNFKVVLG